jgi:hypothetical protein
VENGNYRLSIDSPELKPIADYMRPQGRFKHLTPENMALIQRKVLARYEDLKSKACLGEVSA